VRSLPLRTSLTLWFVGLAGTVLVLASTALFVGVRMALRAGLDAELEARAEGIAALCEWESGQIELEGGLEDSLDVPVLRGANAIEIREWPSMTLVRAFGVELPAASADAAPRSYERNESLRVVGVRAALHDPDAADDGRPHTDTQVLVRVGGSLDTIRQSLIWLAGFALVTCALSLLAVAGFSAFIGGRVVRPLQELGVAAAAVRPGSIPDLPRRGTADEVDHLASILGATFSSLHAALERQRRFTADASHELRTPITILRTEAEVALRRHRSVEEFRALSVRVHETALRMERMVESLLTLTRLDGAAKRISEPVDLATIIEDALADRAPGRQVEIAMQLDPDASAGLNGDADLLRMLVDNLIANALRHAESRVVVSLARTTVGIEFCVRDDGPGVPDDERPFLFERFFRGRNVRGHSGAGLGLAIVEAVVVAHGGECSAEDARPGLRVRVQFPRRIEA